MHLRPHLLSRRRRCCLHPHVRIFSLLSTHPNPSHFTLSSLSWCDTSASTFGRMFGYLTPPLPQSLPIPFASARLPLPFARRKSTAGFIASSLTGALIVFGFWTLLAPYGAQPASLPDAVLLDNRTPASLPLAIIAIVSGVLAGVAEAIGSSHPYLFPPP